MSNPGEKAYLEAKIQQLSQERMNLPRQFEALKKQQELKIDAFLQEVGVLGKVQELRNEVERYRQAVQTRADNLAGQIEALQEILNGFHVQTISSPDQIDKTTGNLLPESRPVVEADEVTQMEDFSEEDLPEKPSEEDEEEYDEEAEAIENAPDEQALRALLSRYRKS